MITATARVAVIGATHARPRSGGQNPAAAKQIADCYLTVIRPSLIGSRSYVATGKLWQLTWRVREIM